MKSGYLAISFFISVALLMPLATACTFSEKIKQDQSTPVSVSSLPNSSEQYVLPDLALSWTKNYESPSQQIKTLAVYKEKLYAGGFTGQADGKIYVYDELSWAEIVFKPDNDLSIDMIEAMHVFDNKLYIGTRVHDQNGNYFSSVYLFDGLGFSEEFTTEGHQGCSGIEAITLHENSLYVANGACGLGEVFVRKADKNWDMVGGKIIGGDPARALVSFDQNLYVGTGAGGSKAKIWKLSNDKWILEKDFSAVSGSPDGVWSMEADLNNLYISFANSSANIISYDTFHWNTSLKIANCQTSRLANTGGRIWAGSCNGEIFVNEKSTWLRAGTQPSSFVNEITQYGDYIYLATNSGVIYRAFLPPIN